MKKLQKKLQFLTLVLIAGLLFSGVALNVEAFIQKQGTVNEAVTLRQNADASSSQVMELTNGQQVNVNNELTGSDGKSWYQVVVNETTIGYVPASTVTISSSSGNQGSSTPTSGATITTMQTVTIKERIGTVTATSAIRVRAEASTSSDHIASMQPNDTFLVLEDVNASDGYVWYKVEFDDNGTTVIGHVRSDLVKVEERTREEQVPVETPVTPPVEGTPVEAPYSISSQVNAEGTTVWYLVDNATGDAKEITSLLTPQEKESGGNGVYKVIVVVLLILVILAAAAATFFYMKWQDAEMFIYELREQQARARKQPGTTRPAQKQPTKQAPGARPAGITSGATVSAKPAQSSTVTKPANSAPAKQLPPLSTDTGKVAAKTAPVQSASVSKPAEQAVSKPASQPAAKAATQPETKTVVKPESKPVVKDVIPHTTDIVNATKKELQDKQTAPAASTKSSGWKSKNFLTDDDDLEFDFLDMDEK